MVLYFGSVILVLYLDKYFDSVLCSALWFSTLFCILALYFGSVLWFCTLVLYFGFVLWFCTLVLYFGSVLWFCTLVLYFGSVLWFCTLVLYFCFVLWLFTSIITCPQSNLFNFSHSERAHTFFTVCISFCCE